VWGGLAGAGKFSALNAAAPARCMAERTAVSMASRSRRPLLRWPWKMTCKRCSPSRATSWRIASAVFFSLQRTPPPESAASGRSVHSLPATPGSIAENDGIPRPRAVLCARPHRSKESLSPSCPRPCGLIVSRDRGRGRWLDGNDSAGSHSAHP
jgi:hypothetical protein